MAVHCQCHGIAGVTTYATFTTTVVAPATATATTTTTLLEGGVDRLRSSISEPKILQRWLSESTAGLPEAPCCINFNDVPTAQPNAKTSAAAATGTSELHDQVAFAGL